MIHDFLRLAGESLNPAAYDMVVERRRFIETVQPHVSVPAVADELVRILCGGWLAEFLRLYLNQNLPVQLHAV